MPILLVLFILIPLIEMAILIEVGKLIGLWQTILLVVGLSVFGAYVISRQSLRSIREAQQSLARGEMPINSVLDGVFLMLAGGLLLTPGLLTDVFGLLLLIPPLRRTLAQWAFARMSRTGKVHVRTFGTRPRPQHDTDRGAPPAPSSPAEGPVIEGEFERLDEKSMRPKPNGRSPNGRNSTWRN